MLIANTEHEGIINTSEKLRHIIISKEHAKPQETETWINQMLYDWKTPNNATNYRDLTLKILQSGYFEFLITIKSSKGKRFNSTTKKRESYANWTTFYTEYGKSLKAINSKSSTVYKSVYQIIKKYLVGDHPLVGNIGQNS